MPDADPLAPLLRLEGVPSAFAASPRRHRRVAARPRAAPYVERPDRRGPPDRRPRVRGPGGLGLVRWTRSAPGPVTTWPRTRSGSRCTCCRSCRPCVPHPSRPSRGCTRWRPATPSRAGPATPRRWPGSRPWAGCSTATTAAPALLVAAVVHADLATAAPFPSHNGIVARAAERLVWVARGVDERSVLVPEAGHLALRAAYESNLRGYRDGGAGGVHGVAEVRRRGGRQGCRGEPARPTLTIASRPSRCEPLASEGYSAPGELRSPTEMRRHPNSSKAGAATDTQDRWLPGVHTPTAASESFRWLAPCRKGRSPRGYPVRVLLFSSTTSVLRRSREAHKP